MKVGDMTLRPATLDDAEFVADILTERYPDDPEDPVLLRHAWTVIDPDATVERFITSAGGADIGYVSRSHQSWAKMPERFGRMSCSLRSASWTPARVDALIMAMEELQRADGVERVTMWAWEDDPDYIAILAKRGFCEERRERFWELDLALGRDRITKMAAESRARMKTEGVRLLTLAEDGDPKKLEKLKVMSDEAESDVPTTVPHVILTMAEFMKWFDSPGLRPDRSWIARDGDDIVGISQLSYPPVRGVVSTDWTGMARRARGRGIARALKCETLMQAIALGVDRVRTDNDSANAPILHINETMGYRRRHDGIQFLKVL
jgi:RimJ/RimL family protein N-acetyltransferase